MLLVNSHSYILLTEILFYFNWPRHLEEREVLKAKVESMERKLEERDNDIRQLTRRNYLEVKNFKTQLASERKKYKELCQKQTIEKTGEKISSNDSDYSSAKDVKEVRGFQKAETRKARVSRCLMRNIVSLSMIQR